MMGLAFLTPKRVLLAAVIGATVYAFWWTYSTGEEAGANAVRLEYEQKIKIQRDNHQAELIAAERKAAADMAAIDQAHQEAMTNAQTEIDRLVDAVRSGEQRLRDRFKCPANGVPQAGGSPGGSHAGTAGGLQSEDAEFLIREAARADAVVRQLQACQAVVKADRKAIFMPEKNKASAVPTVPADKRASQP